MTRLPLALVVTDAGSARLVRGQLAYLASRGFDVHLVSAPGRIAETIARAEGARHHAVAMRRDLAPAADARALVELGRLFRRTRPLLVDGSTPKAGLLAMIAAAAARVPVRVHTLRGLRHTTLAPAKAAVTWAGHRLTCSLAHRVVCVSDGLRAQAIAAGVVSPDRAIVLGPGSGNGVDLAAFTATPARSAAAAALRARVDPSGRAPLVGYVGRVARDKGIADLARAWPGLAATGAHLLVVGKVDPTDPPDAGDLAALRDRADVHWLGELDDVAPIYLAVDVVVMPSRREGFNNVLLEAAAMERPTVTTAIPGCGDAVIDGVTGTVIAPADPDGLAAAVRTYLGDPALRARHGAAGRARVARDFVAADVHRRVADEYLRLLAAAGVVPPP